MTMSIAELEELARSVKKRDDSPDERDKLTGWIMSLFGDFAQLAMNEEKHSEECLCIRGLTWRILVKKNGPPDDSLGIYISCEKEGNGWNCHANVKIYMLNPLHYGKSQLQTFQHNFHADKSQAGIKHFLKLEKILEPNNGWLGHGGDGGIFVFAFLRVDEPQGIGYVTRPNVLSVNGEEVKVNKHQLACNSDYFESFFFGENYKKENTLELVAPATVEHFERMMDTMEPENRPLDDHCIEGVLQLANQFLLNGVEGKCRDFLAEKSKRSAMFKYRLADKYGFHLLKERLLISSKKEDFFKEADFFENLNEFVQLNEKARQALNSQLGKLFGVNFETADEPPPKRRRAAN